MKFWPWVLFNIDFPKPSSGNRNWSKEWKLSLIKYTWKTAEIYTQFFEVLSYLWLKLLPQKILAIKKWAWSMSKSFKIVKISKFLQSYYLKNSLEMKFSEECLCSFPLPLTGSILTIFKNVSSADRAYKHMFQKHKQGVEHSKNIKNHLLWSEK